MSKSATLFQQAQQYIVGGVNSPVRAFNAVGGVPPFIERGIGAHLIDADQRRYIDYVGSWGTAILGHAHPEVVAAVQQTAAKGLSFGAPTELETELARLICKFIPTLEKIRFVNSGTEATMTAIRLARGITQRRKIIKFEGCYHGHHDALLVKAGSGALTLGQPSSAGVPSDFAQHTLIANFNDTHSLQALFTEHGDDIAALILEPVAGNMNCILPQPEFLAACRKLCNDYQSLLIFDEVMTGFRLGAASAQHVFKVTPDLTTLGKVIGGGMPVGAIGGPAKFMEYLAPLGPVYQAGTLSGNPIAMAAGLTTLQIIEREPTFFTELSARTQTLVNGLLQHARDADVALTTNSCGSMFGFFFTAQPKVTTYAQATQCNAAQFKPFFHAMLKRGIYLAPSAFEAGFMSSAHTAADIEQTLQAAHQAFTELQTTAIN